MTRLEPLFNDTVHLKQAEKFLPKTSLTLLSKKIAAQAGDVRSLFEVLRGAIDSASKASTDIALDGPVPVVTPNHIISALKSYAPRLHRSRRQPPATQTPPAQVRLSPRSPGSGYRHGCRCWPCSLLSRGKNKVSPSLPFLSRPHQRPPPESRL
jgi:hypothetical protein